MGRTSPVPSWIEALGGTRAGRRVVSVRPVIYYGRYFQLLPERNLPEGPWLTCFGPRGDLGYAMFATFVGDNRTFALVLGIPTWDSDLRILKHTAAFMAACRELPALRAWADDTFAEPITPVMPMGALENTLRNYQPNGGPCVTGLVPVADAVCHTDPAFGLGLSFALLHAEALACALRELPADRDAQARAYWSRIWPELRERFNASRDLDNARNELWKGTKLDFTRRAGCYPLFALIAGGVVATRDAEVCRKWLRRATLLDRMSIFDDDLALQERVESAFAEILKAGTPPKAGPDRETLLARLRAAVPE